MPEFEDAWLLTSGTWLPLKPTKHVGHKLEVSTSSRGCGGLGCHWVEFPKLYILPLAQPETQPRVAEYRTTLR